MTTEETQNLTRIHQDARSAYKAVHPTPDGIATPDDTKILKTLGISTQFLFDCVDDLSRYGEPDLKTFLALCDLRAGYFREVQMGVPAPRAITECELPPKAEEFDGIAWLPRMIRKADCFLHGCLCPDIMYGCAGDRAFLTKHQVSLPEFLSKVRDTMANPALMAEFLRSSK